MADVTVTVRGATFRISSPGSVGAREGSLAHLEVEVAGAVPRRFDAHVHQSQPVDFRETEVLLPQDLPADWDLETLRRIVRAYFRDVIGAQLLVVRPGVFSGTIPQEEQFNETWTRRLRATPAGWE